MPTTTDRTTDAAPAELAGVTKRYGATIALDDLSPSGIRRPFVDVASARTTASSARTTTRDVENHYGPIR